MGLRKGDGYVKLSTTKMLHKLLNAELYIIYNSTNHKYDNEKAQLNISHAF